MSKDLISFKCDIDLPKDLWESFDKYGMRIKKIQEGWKNGPVVLNEGTEYECTAIYVTWSRIDGNPIFQIEDDDFEKLKYGVFTTINGYELKSKKIQVIGNVHCIKYLENGKISL